MRHACLLGAVALGLLVLPARADWDPGDPYKMHFPQLPDPNGWDVAATYTGQPPNDVSRHVADDWQCSESGPVTSIHFWGSYQGDIPGIDHFEIGIWADDPAGPGGYFPDNPYSMPAYKIWNDQTEDWDPGLLWYWGVYPGEYTERLYGTGVQGWFDPHDGTHVQNDHTFIYQYNIDCSWLPNIFFQEQGTIYWLMVQAYTVAGTEWGWKTSLNHWNDDATYYDSLVQVPPGYPHEGWWRENWIELYDPLTQYSLDMAFVIVPEPATLGLLLAGVLVLARRR